jgi:hypothetical protein
MVLMHRGLIDLHFVPHNLISAQENPVPLPQFQMAPRINILMSSGSKKCTQLYYPCLSKIPGKRISSRFPNGPPMERDTRLQDFFLSLLIYIFLSFPQSSSKGAPSLFLNRVPMDRDTPSPEPLVYIFIHSCLPESPERSPPTYGEKHKVTIHRAPCRQKAYIQWGAAWFPKGIVNDTAVTTPVPCSPQRDIFHLGLGSILAWVDQNTVSQRVS